MLNQVVLIGRITEDIKIKGKEGETKIANLDIAVQRNYKNSEGTYDTDIIKITLWNGVAENVAEYCKKGDLIGIKGRIQTYNNTIQIIAEKVSFLSSKASEII